MLSSCLGATGHFRFNLTKRKEHRRHLSSALPERLEQLEELDEGKLVAMGDGAGAETLDTAHLLLDTVHTAP